MSQLTAQQPEQKLDENGRRRFVQVFSMLAIYALCLFPAAGTLRWWNAWAYLIVFALSILTGGLYVARKNPAIINERGRASDKTKPFDKWFGRLSIPLALGAFVVAGLDARFGWSAVPLWLQIAAFAGMLPSFFTPYWVMLVNAYAATTVRVETERGQHVISDGPYRFVRHPMYSGVVLGYLLMPLALGSWWAAGPSWLLITLFVWRTAREDATLLAELPGYADYAQRTRYRLLPGVW
jgi:protein-S-isoprenylcysteine O-methyltransferase Ste14